MEVDQLSQWLSIILLGAAAGFIARLFFGRRGGSGLIGNIIVGVIGAIIGAYLFERFNINIDLSGFENWIYERFNVRVGFLNSLFQAVVGASLLLIILGFFGKRRRS